MRVRALMTCPSYERDGAPKSAKAVLAARIRTAADRDVTDEEPLALADRPVAMLVEKPPLALVRPPVATLFAFAAGIGGQGDGDVAAAVAVRVCALGGRNIVAAARVCHMHRRQVPVAMLLLASPEAFASFPAATSAAAVSIAGVGIEADGDIALFKSPRHQQQRHMRRRWRCCRWHLSIDRGRHWRRLSPLALATSRPLHAMALRKRRPGSRPSDLITRSPR